MLEPAETKDTSEAFEDLRLVVMAWRTELCKPDDRMLIPNWTVIIMKEVGIAPYAKVVRTAHTALMRSSPGARLTSCVCAHTFITSDFHTS